MEKIDFEQDIQQNVSDIFDFYEQTKISTAKTKRFGIALNMINCRPHSQNTLYLIFYQDSASSLNDLDEFTISKVVIKILARPSQISIFRRKGECFQP